MQKVSDAMKNMVSTVVEGLGFELVGVEFLSRNKGGNLLRVYIDHQEGITMDNCADVSHQLSGVLDVEDPIPGEYNLEISSPGLDRPLFEPHQFEQFTGHGVKLKLYVGLDGRRNFKGVIDSVNEREVVLMVDEESIKINFDDIQSARLIPEF